MKRRILIILAVFVPLALFFVARLAAGRRPIIIGADRGARTLLLSPDGTQLFSRGQYQVQAWSTTTRENVGQWPVPGAWLVPSPDGTRVVSASSPVASRPDSERVVTRLLGAVRTPKSGAIICQFHDRWTHSKSLQDALQDLKWSADGREIVVLTNRAVRRFDARDGHLIKRVTYDAANNYTSWLLSPDARFVIATDRDGAHFFDAASGQETHFWKHPAVATRNSPIIARAILPGGQWIWMQRRNGPNNATAFFVRASDGHLVWSKPQIDTSFYGFKICNFSRDGQLILSLEQARIVVRQSANGQEVWHLDATMIQDAALSPDARFVYSLDARGTIRRWNVPSR